MKALSILIAAGLFLAAPTEAEILLKPADPQPDAAALTAGLHVTYAYPQDVTSLQAAEYHVNKAPFKSKPLVGFDYPDTKKGDNVMTARQAYVVAARIEGFIRFDEAGVFELNFQSNDGLRVHIGGEEVSEHDGRHPCSSPGAVTVRAPSPGWYPLEAIYFQRQGTSCLLMEWGPAGGELDWTPNDAFAFIPK